MLMIPLRWLPAAAALLAVFAPAAPAAGPRPKPADFTINLMDGKTLTLSQYRGHPVVLAFILTSCPHCQAAVKVLSKLQTEYGSRGLQVLASAIEQDSQAHIALFIKNFAPPFPVGYNSGTEAEALIRPTGRLPMMPLMGIFDKKGILLAQHEGEEPYFTDLETNLRKEIEPLLQSKR